MRNINFNTVWLSTARLAVLSFVSFSSVLVLALAAHAIAVSTSIAPGLYAIYAVFGLAVAALTLLTVPALLIVDLVRRGAIINKIFVEVACLSTLAILWLTAAALTGDAYRISWAFCNLSRRGVPSTCREAQAMAAFSHLNWLWLFAYLTAIVIFAIVSQNNGVQVWHSSVRDNKFACSGPAPSTIHGGTYETDPSKAYPVQSQVPGAVPYVPQPGVGGYDQTYSAPLSAPMQQQHQQHV
ncbi:hypothetical protein BXZ70DRAFT_1004566 [Cristinia sonorae]|uniref:MARVEL domain-containing protein n=1 Tax=Cristinia sonorae TaxID=1940300 RepID=A0A8K0UXL5_9AGAR|nr:hypothetical protein BXZ70DRAFT_1004566 [Cristinia sonorae]